MREHSSLKIACMKIHDRKSILKIQNQIPPVGPEQARTPGPVRFHIWFR